MKDRRKQSRNRRSMWYRRLPFLTAASSLLLLPSGVEAFATNPTGGFVRRTRLLAEQEPEKASENLFGDHSGQSPDKKEASFGDVVPLKRPDGTVGATAKSAAQFGESVPLKRPDDAQEALDNMRKRNAVVAVVSILFALSNWFYSFFHPIDSIELLAQMERESPELSVIAHNGKPTVVDFWAPWCENCKLEAPTLKQLHDEYADRINFIAINGDDWDRNAESIEAFGVDAIPHIALVSETGEVETALIGPIPKSVLRSDFDTLVKNVGSKNRQELPHKMLDAFANKESRKVEF